MKKVERGSQNTEASSSNHATPASGCHPSGNSVEMPQEQAPDRRLINNYSTISAMHNLTAMLMKQSDFEDAAPMSEEIFEKMKLILGEKHLDTLMAMNNVAVVKHLRGSIEEATAMFADLHEKIKVLPVDDDPRTFSIMNNIANVLEKQGHFGKAAEVLTELVDRSKRTIGEEHPYTTSAVQLLAALEARSAPEKGKAVIQATDESHSTMSCDDGYGPEVIESYRSRESADVLGEQPPEKSLGKPTADRDIKGSERSVPPDGSAAMTSKQLEEDFKYDPLDKGHIRIAVVEPGTRDTLKVTLYHGPIDYCAQTPYFALSYAWGDTTIKTDILCRDMQMKIGLNLHSALCRLRHPTQRVAV